MRHSFHKSIFLFLFAFLLIGLLGTGVSSAQSLLINYPVLSPGGDGIGVGLDITSYPGSSLYSVVLYISANNAGNYTYSLTAYDTCFNGALIGGPVDSGTVTQDGNASDNLPVTFLFPGNPQVNYGDAVGLALAQTSGPSYCNICILGNYGGLTGSAIGVNELASKDACLSSVIRNGYAVQVYGNPPNTPTFTPTITDTPTITFTPTNTYTPTNSPTCTSTDSPTDTATATPTDTPTMTATNSATNTPTDSSTQTATNTPTFTSTNTATPTPSLTPTNTATITSTITATNSMTASPSITPTPSPTLTHTAVPTSTFTNTLSPTPTLTPTSTATLPTTSTPTPNAPLYLSRNYFNPLTGQTLGIDSLVARAGSVQVLVFNIAGQEVVKVADTSLPAGSCHFSWDGRNSSGALVGNGVYFIVIKQPSGNTTRKVIILR